MDWRNLASQIMSDNSLHRLEKELERAYNAGLADRKLETTVEDRDSERTEEVEKVEVKIHVCTKTDNVVVSKRLETIILDHTFFSCRQNRQYETKYTSDTGGPIDYTPIGKPYLVLHGVVIGAHNEQVPLESEGLKSS